MRHLSREAIVLGSSALAFPVFSVVFNGPQDNSEIIQFQPWSI